MSRLNFLFSSLFVGAALASILRLSVKPGTTRTTSRNNSYNAIDSYITGQMRRLNIPGVSLVIVEEDQIVHARGFGRARPGGETPTLQTPFFIGSLTKSITALAVMQLVEAGKVELDAPIQYYLPWFRVANAEESARITVRHLLNQTSGLPTSAGDIEQADFDDRPDATERQARALATLKLAFPVGSAVEYANMNYNLLGLIIEAASAESYTDYVHKHIFSPLNMNCTTASLDTARQNGLAMGHKIWFGKPFAAPDMHIPHGSLPSGWFISSAEDMARYLIAHLNGGCYGNAQILSSAGIDTLHRGEFEYRRMGVSAGKYAMGWLDGEIGQSRIVWHSGTTPVFGAYMALLPEQRTGVVLLFNACHWWYNPAQTEFGMGVAALLAGEPYRPTPYFSIIPWILRGQLLIPVFQVADVITTMGLLQRWRAKPERRPNGWRKWVLHFLLPLIPNLLTALSLYPMLGKKRGYMKLYMPDFSLLAAICGSFAVAWSLLRSGLVIRSLRKRS